MRKRLLHGPALKKIRELTGIPQQELAVQCHISPGYLANLEAGRKQPAATLIPKLADHLGVEIKDITYVVSSEITDEKVAA